MTIYEIREKLIETRKKIDSLTSIDLDANYREMYISLAKFQTLCVEALKVLEQKEFKAKEECYDEQYYGEYDSCMVRNRTKFYLTNDEEQDIYLYEVTTNFVDYDFPLRGVIDPLKKFLVFSNFIKFLIKFQNFYLGRITYEEILKFLPLYKDGDDNFLENVTNFKNIIIKGLIAEMKRLKNYGEKGPFPGLPRDWEEVSTYHR